MKEKSRNQILLSRQLSRIMIIDDEHVLLNAIKKYLMAKEFNIITCNSGKEALRRVKKEKIDLLIVDILMYVIDNTDAGSLEVLDPILKKMIPGIIDNILQVENGKLVINKKTFKEKFACCFK